MTWVLDEACDNLVPDESTVTRVMDEACDGCLARSWLLARLAGHLEHLRGRIDSVLALDDADLIDAVAGRDAVQVRAELEGFDARGARDHSRRRGLATLCSCGQRYPSRLRDLDAAPRALYVTGGLHRFVELAGRDPVAIVGARRVSPYGVEVARSLARGLTVSGVTVVSGMAMGVDSASHAGTLAASGTTLAVLPGGADRPYPTSKRQLYGQILQSGAAVSELPPGVGPWRWCFPARNRLIAGLAAMTVVVEAGERSGALLTANFTRRLARPLGAVPGRVTSPSAAGPNELLREGARVIRDAQDVLDVLVEAGLREPGPEAPQDPRPPLAPELGLMLEELARGRDPASAAERAGLSFQGAMAALAELELGGYVRREPGGAYTPTA